VSEHLLLGITIPVAASLIIGGCTGAMKGFFTIHSGRTLRAIIVCENVWVVVVLGTQALQVYSAFGQVSTKDFVLLCLIFVLIVPSLSWVYSRSDAAVEAMLLKINCNSD
jgi:hypothetical protein